MKVAAFDRGDFLFNGMKKKEIIIIVIALMLVATCVAALALYSQSRSMTAAVVTPEVRSESPGDKAPAGADEVQNVASEEKPQKESEPEPEKTVLEKYKELLDVNPYVSGWLSVPGANIDDPVVYTPGSQNYYLHRDIDGTPLEKGTFFIAINWHDGCYNTLIYGHNMRNGDGFGSLLKYADESFGKEHLHMRFDTLYE